MRVDWGEGDIPNDDLCDMGWGDQLSSEKARIPIITGKAAGKSQSTERHGWNSQFVSWVLSLLLHLFRKLVTSICQTWRLRDGERDRATVT